MGIRERTGVLPAWARTGKEPQEDISFQGLGKAPPLDLRRPMLQCELPPNGQERNVAQSKVYPDAASALAGLTFDGMTVMAGGFGLSGNPENLIEGLRADGTQHIRPLG